MIKKPKCRFELLLISMSLIFTLDVIAQAPTFNKTYNQLGDLTAGFFIHELDDGNYIAIGFRDNALITVNLDLTGNIIWNREYESVQISNDRCVRKSKNNTYLINGYLQDNLVMAEIDQSGDIIWSKEYDTFQPSSNPPFGRFRTGQSVSNFVHSDDNSYVIVSTKVEPQTMASHVMIIKLNQVGDTLWTKTIDNNGSSDIGYDIYETLDGGLIIGANSRTFKINPKIIKTDSLGNVQWIKIFELDGISPILLALTNNVYLISGKNEVHKIDETGSTIWVKKCDYTIASVYSSGKGEIFILGRNRLEKINSDGDLIWLKEYNSSEWSTLKEISIINDDCIILIGLNNTLLKTDSEGNIVWQKELFGIPNSVSMTNDEGYILTGRSEGDYYKLWILKTNKDGNFVYLGLRRPFSNSLLHIEDCIQITWYSLEIENVDIAYSLDNGLSWENIATNYNSYNGNNSINWEMPDILTSEAIISINSTNNLLLSDTVNFSMIYDSNKRFNYNFISANEIKMWIGNNGDGSHDPASDGSGFFWPGGNCAHISAVFEDGFVYGGIVDGNVNVNGSTYRQGWQPGNILEDGTGADPNDAIFKIWKIKKGWESMLHGPIRDELEFDYNNWPVEYGAPWVDVDSDGIFNRSVDKPKFLGDETLYHVSNDLDPERTSFTYGSPPIGLEFQVTVWAHDTTDFLKDVVFKKYTMINKSGNSIEDMYFSYWTDDDLGFVGDDYVGCDTTLNLGYTYNADNDDDDFFGENPPAIGHMMIKSGNQITQSLASFSLYINAHPVYSWAEHGVYSGSLEMYNNMKGFLNNGDPYINPNTGEITKFCLAGDPVAGTGWFEGEGWLNGMRAGNRGYLMSSGPFDVAPEDTQEVVYAIFMAQGSDNIQSVAELKNTARAIQNYWDNVIYTDVEDQNTSHLPTQFVLSQNYPNPFNSTTTIRYSIPSPVISNPLGDERSPNNEIFPPTSWARNNKINVELVVFDILGRQLKTLVNENQKPGNYTVEFDASNLSSGVYFYRLKRGDFISTKKMLLLK